jgi:hypothetical protein
VVGRSPASRQTRCHLIKQPSRRSETLPLIGNNPECTSHNLKSVRLVLTGDTRRIDNGPQRGRRGICPMQTPIQPFALPAILRCAENGMSASRRFDSQRKRLERKIAKCLEGLRGSLLQRFPDQFGKSDFGWQARHRLLNSVQASTYGRECTAGGFEGDSA